MKANKIGENCLQKKKVAVCYPLSCSKDVWFINNPPNHLLPRRRIIPTHIFTYLNWEPCEFHSLCGGKNPRCIILNEILLGYNLCHPITMLSTSSPVGPSEKTLFLSLLSYNWVWHRCDLKHLHFPG